jgi:uncharacterized membrane protein
MENQQGGRSPASYESALEADRERSIRTLAHVLYALYAVHWFTGGISGIVAIIVDYLKRPDAAGTAYAVHFEWQIRTFWMGLVGYVIGAILTIVGIGFIVLAAVSIWMLYRIVKGWLYLFDNKPLEARAWF